MKSIISILLIVITAFYVLPVSNGFMADAETTTKYVDKSAEDGQDLKKDSGKEFIPAGLVITSSRNSTTTGVMLQLLSILPVHFTIETPPPDRA